MTLPKSKKNRAPTLEKAALHFSSAVKNFENDDYQGTIDQAKSMVEELDRAVEELHRDYAQSLLTHRLTTLPADKSQIEKAQHETKPNAEELIAVLLHLEKHLLTLTKEYARLHPTPPVIEIWVRKNQKIVIPSIAAILLMVFGLVGWHRWESNRKGLLGSYFRDVNLASFVGSHVDPCVNFKWGRRPAWKHGKNSNYSIRWDGYLFAPGDDEYELLTKSDDGVRLYLDNHLLIDNWTTHAETMNRASVDLKRGYHRIKIEYFQKGGPASIRLYWKTKNELRPEIISPEFLVPSRELLKSNVPVFEDQRPL